MNEVDTEKKAVWNWWFDVSPDDLVLMPSCSCKIFNDTPPVSSQAGQLVVGQEQFRSSLRGYDGWLDGWNEDPALQGGLLRGQLQLLWHPGQDLHRVRQPHTQIHTHTELLCLFMSAVYTGPQYPWQDPGIWRGSWWSLYTHTHSCSQRVKKAIEPLPKVSRWESW